MTPSLAAIQAAISTRQWVRAKRFRLGREPTPDEVAFYVDGNWSKLKPADRAYVLECSSPKVLTSHNDYGE